MYFYLTNLCRILAAQRFLAQQGKDVTLKELLDIMDANFKDPTMTRDGLAPPTRHPPDGPLP